ncbi:hypothetical protein PSAB6_450181 [Paraburkholderia sabiae]|nr:hypothetical protein PSAB6_450181 [Paraburkholderia sabiae]
MFSRRLREHFQTLGRLCCVMDRAFEPIAEASEGVQRLVSLGLRWTDSPKPGILSVSLWRRISHQPCDFAALLPNLCRMRP